MANFHVEGLNQSTGQINRIASGDIKTDTTGIPDLTTPPYDAKTSNYTIVATDNGKTFTNTGASSNITFTITEGINIRFSIIRVANYEIRVISSGSDTIQHLGGVYVASENIILGSNGAKITLSYDSSLTRYFALVEAGMVSCKPDAIPGLIIHLDATISASLTLDGSDVTTWEDQTSNNNDVSQSSGSNRPTLVTDAFGSGLNGIDFTTDQWLESGTYTTHTFSPFTVVVVAQCDTTDANPHTVWWMGDKDSSDNYWELYFEGTPDQKLELAITKSGSSVETASTITSWSASTTTIFTLKERNILHRTIYKDGNGIGKDDSNRTQINSDKFSIGRRDGTSPTSYHEGLIGHVMMWNRALREEEIAALHLHLGNKWGVTV